MKQLTLKEILKGTTPGRMQTVGLMQVIPLLSDMEFEGYVTPEQGGKISTSSYGQLVFENNSDDTVIVPNNAAYLKKTFGQDHAMTSAGVVRKKSTKVYRNAVCVQQNTGGHIPKEAHPFTIMPFSLREPILKTRKDSNYGRHWGDITNFNRSLGITSTAGHLEYFYDAFNKELDQFVAEFETVNRQVGAIVLINGVVVGIERAPNYKYWKTLWKEIIRSCYGSLAIQVMRSKSEDKKEVEKIRIPLPKNKAKNVAELNDLLDATEAKQKTIASDTIRELLAGTFNLEIDEDEAKIKRVNVSNDDFLGQLITDGDVVIYASMVTSNKSFRNSKWKKAKEFDI